MRNEKDLYLFVGAEVFVWASNFFLEEERKKEKNVFDFKYNQTSKIFLLTR